MSEKFNKLNFLFVLLGLNSVLRIAIFGRRRRWLAFISGLGGRGQGYGNPSWYLGVALFNSIVFFSICQK